MGYTHYWEQTESFTPEAWETLGRIIQHVEDMTGIPIETSDQSLPIFTDDSLGFNGWGEDAFEDFLLEKDCTGAMVSDFCKTARNDYDVYVVAILHAAAQLNPTGFSWHSDGDNEEDSLTLGKSLADQILNNPEFMTIEQAADIVYDLAVQNALSEDLDELDEMYEEMQRQHKALDTFHDFAINNIHN
jgi:hypothetical protein